MEHACAQCHSVVKDDDAFCSNCGAPQVRFAGREPSSDAVIVQDRSVPPTQVLADETYPTLQPFIQHDSSAVLRSALNAGVIAAILSSIPIGAAFIFALPFAGFLSILFYRRRSLVQEASPRMGFRLGSLTGFFGFLIFVVLTAVETVAFHAQNELRDAMMQAIRQAQARSADPQARQMLDYFMTPQGLAIMMIFGFIFMCILFVVLSGLGGALSAALLRRKSPPS